MPDPVRGRAALPSLLPLPLPLLLVLSVVVPEAAADATPMMVKPLLPLVLPALPNPSLVPLPSGTNGGKVVPGEALPLLPPAAVDEEYNDGDNSMLDNGARFGEDPALTVPAPAPAGVWSSRCRLRKGDARPPNKLLELP